MESIVVAKKEPKIEVTCDPRFGAFIFRVMNVQDREGQFSFPISLVSDWMRQLQAKLPRDQWQGYELELVKPPQRTNDIDQLRYDEIARMNLVGKTVLDIGGHDGRYAAAALKAGAARAVCLDNQQFFHYYGVEHPTYDGVEYITGDAMDWHEPMDMLFFFNVLYHFKNPWRALDHLRTITKEQMLMMTLFRYSDIPCFYLYEPCEYNGTDETVYWGISLSGLERILKFTGWFTEQLGLHHDRVLYRCKPIPGFQTKHEDT